MDLKTGRCFTCELSTSLLKVINKYFFGLAMKYTSKTVCVSQAHFVILGLSRQKYCSKFQVSLD